MAFSYAIRTTTSAFALAVAVARNSTARPSEIESERPERGQVGRPNLIKGQHVLQGS